MTNSLSAKLNIDGMSCASCVGRVERGLREIDGVSDVSVNLASQSVRLQFDKPSDLSTVSRALATLGYPARTESTTLRVESMSCASCVGRVEQAIAAVPGVQSVGVNLATESATVEFLEGVVDAADLVKAASQAGYPANIAVSDSDDSILERRELEARQLLRRVLIAAALALPVFILEMGSHLIPAFKLAIMDTIGMQGSRLIQFVLTTILLLGPGRDFFSKGIPALLKGAPDMNSLVALGTGAAWCYSVVATFLPALLPQNAQAVYFEAAAVIVLLILIGRWFEARAKGRTGAAIQSLLGLQASTATLLRDGETVEVEVETLVVGDRLRVQPGERIPIDGVVTSGSGPVDESMISGEPMPVFKSTGATLIGGTVNGTGSMTFAVTRTGKNTTLAQIIKLVEQAQNAKLPVQGLVDRITLWFVPAVLAVALLTLVAWLIWGPEPSLTLALVASVCVLIIACPCAMGLATPTSIMVGSGRAAQMGVLFRQGDALQALSEIDVIALDKTGTITEGKPQLTELITSAGFERADVLAFAAAAEAQSEHPIATAIVQAAHTEQLTLPAVDKFQSVTGHGIEAQAGGRNIVIGAERLMAQHDIDTSPLAATATELASRGRSTLFAAIDGKLAAAIAIADPIRKTSVAAISALRERGLKVAMITGDRRETAEAIAAEAGIDHVVAGVLPDGKVTALDELSRGDGASKKWKTAFVGDGINDAPALAHADVGIAIGTGTDVAIESAEVVLMSGDLSGVVNAIEVSRSTMSNIRQNLVWAFGYNIALIPLATGALYPLFGLMLSPIFAAGAMALSSVSVLFNALRLHRLKPALDLQAST